MVDILMTVSANHMLWSAGGGTRQPPLVLHRATPLLPNSTQREFSQHACRYPRWLEGEVEIGAVLSLPSTHTNGCNTSTRETVAPKMCFHVRLTELCQANSPQHSRAPHCLGNIILSLHNNLNKYPSNISISSSPKSNSFIFKKAYM